MNKNTFWAVVLSGLVLIGSLWIQNKYFKPDETVVNSEQNTEIVSVDNSTDISSDSKNTDSAVFDNEDIKLAEIVEEEEIPEEIHTITTDFLKVTFTNRGGDIIGYELLNHLDGTIPVQMADNISEQNRAFSLAFGDASSAIENSIFNVKIIDNPDPKIDGDKAIGFYKTIKIKNADGSESSFLLGKLYTFHKDDYLFKLEINIKPIDNFTGLNYNNVAYTLQGSPQIGPFWNKSKDRYDYRTFMSYTDGKQKKKRLGDDKVEIYDKEFTWTGITNKYFAELIVPIDNTIINKATYSTAIELDDYANAQVKTTRKAFSTTDNQVDTYYIYVGPLTESSLKLYNNAADNGWGLDHLYLNDAMRSSGILSWLEALLKWIMELFYILIPNWGVSIILLTILFRAIMFPLTKKQSTGTVKMQELQPQMKEIQNKYKDNPKKMNEEMSKFYKETGYNPMSGCLPLLIQFPIIIAMYNLFNNYFDFRGAMFIPGWIPDLSLPDTVFTYNFTIPLVTRLLGNQIHLLPILYVITQIISMKITQTQNTSAGTGSMKFMLYGMPIMFFFIFYNAPSGLLIYWILSNVLMTGQQAVINSVVHGKEKKEKSALPPKKEVRLPPSAKKMYNKKKKK